VAPQVGQEHVSQVTAESVADHDPHHRIGLARLIDFPVQGHGVLQRDQA
jgi:hypothetical protein